MKEVAMNGEEDLIKEVEEEIKQLNPIEKDT